MLVDRGLDFRKANLEVAKLLKPGPDVVTTDQLPQTPRARQVIQHAIEQARQFADRSIGTGYLLLGLLHVQKGVAARVLVNVGLDREAVRKEVIGRLDAGDD